MARDDLLGRRFGVSVALSKDLMAVGAPESGASFTGAVYLYREVREDGWGVWVQAADLDALQPLHGGEFGAAVALSEDFLVVTSPGPARGDRVTVFALRPPEGGDQ